MPPLKETNINVPELIRWAGKKKKVDPSFVMLISVPELHGVFLACPKGVYNGLFVLPRNTSLHNGASKLRGWGYAVYRAKDTGQAMDYLIEYVNGL